MFKYYLKTALKSLAKQKLFTIVNVVSLSVGLGIGLISFLWVTYQLSFDTFHTKKNRIVRLLKQDEQLNKINTGFPFNTDSLLKQQVPQVEEAALVTFNQLKISKDKTKYFSQSTVATNSNLFKIFSFQIIKGNLLNALDEKNGVVISSSFAKTHFPNQNPLGKTLYLKNYVNDFLSTPNLIIKAVIQDVPINSKFQGVQLFVNANGIYEKQLNDLANRISFGNKLIPFHLGETFVLLKKNINELDAAQNINRVVSSNSYMSEYAKKSSIFFQKLKDMHLYSKDISGSRPDENIQQVYIFSGVAILFLGGSLLNFFGFIIISYNKRLKEIGINKFSGADNYKVFYALSLESLLLLLICIPFSLIMAFYFLYGPISLMYMQNMYAIGLINWLNTIIYFSIILLFALIPSFYASYYISKINAIELVKKKITTVNRSKFLWRFFVTMQLAIPILLIASSFAIRNQISYLRNYDKGYSVKNIYSLYCYPLGSNYTNSIILERYVDVMIDKLNAKPGVEIITRSSWDPSSQYIGSGGLFYLNGKQLPIAIASVDTSFFKAVGIKLLTPTYLLKHAKDFTTIVITKNLAKIIGKDYKNITFPFNWDNYTIIGVVDDIHIGSFKETAHPLAFHVSPTANVQGYTLLFKVHYKNRKDVLDYVRKEWRNLTGGTQLSLVSLDNSSYSQFQFLEEETLLSNINIFSIVTLFMALISIFTTIAYNTNKRVKEIGVRKVFGASQTKIISLFVNEVIVLVFIATVITIPFVNSIMSKWLMNFTHKTALGIDIYLFPFFIVLAVSLVTVIYHVILASRANPVDSLKYE